jgi:transglutaminase-like putative cysteine protease
MKKRLLFLMFILLLPIVCAQGWVFNSEYLELELDISSKIKLVPSSSKYNVEYVIANLSFVPEDGFQQEVLSIETEPHTDVENGNVLFAWDEPDKKELSFSLKSDVKTFNKIVKVKNKVKFPLSDLPGEVEIYTEPSETIDSNNRDIIRKASEIIKGEDDLYVIVFKLGGWTKQNIDYDLSTLTESVSQKASWVLKNKEGVCDELTNLFIAMNRALGIPAKFVSGVAYTNAEEFGEGFGPHGWAEVYFPDYGWIPFDVTYGEFGFIDSGHIKLKESLDANDASTRFQWLGKDVDVKTNPLDINVEIKDVKGNIGEFVSIDARAVKSNIGFGSYNLIEATVENLREYYVATELRLSKSKEIEIIGEEKKTVLLKPNEEKDVNWIIKISDNLERGYVYTFPFIVGSLRNITAELRFDAIGEGKRFSLEGIENLIEESEEEKSYLGKVEISCKADKDKIYEYENTNIDCDVKNVGNIYLDELNVCLDEDCKKISLGITEEERVGFDFEPKEIGVQEVVVKASSKDVSKSGFLDMVVYDKPSIDIDELVYPKKVEYKDMYEVSFILNKKSMFAPYNITIEVEPVDKEWEINQLSEDRMFRLKMYANELKAGENNFEILIRYKDRNGKEYETSEEFKINLVNVNIFQRIILFFRHLF